MSLHLLTLVTKNKRILNISNETGTGSVCESNFIKIKTITEREKRMFHESWREKYFYPTGNPVSVYCNGDLMYCNVYVKLC
jgi:hypothetical protein